MGVSRDSEPAPGGFEVVKSRSSSKATAWTVTSMLPYLLGLCWLGKHYNLSWQRTGQPWIALDSPGHTGQSLFPSPHHHKVPKCLPASPPLCSTLAPATCITHLVAAGHCEYQLLHNIHHGNCIDSRLLSKDNTAHYSMPTRPPYPPDPSPAPPQSPPASSSSPQLSPPTHSSHSPSSSP